MLIKVFGSINEDLGSFELEAETGIWTLAHGQSCHEVVLPSLRWGECRFGRIDQALDNGFDRNAFGFRPVVQQDPMAQGGFGEGLDVLQANVRPVLQQCSGLRTEHQELSGACPSSPTDPLIDKVWRGRLPGPRRRREPNRVTNQFL